MKKDTLAAIIRFYKANHIDDIIIRQESFNDIDFDGINLIGVRFEKCAFYRCYLTKNSLTGAQFAGCMLINFPVITQQLKDLVLKFGGYIINSNGSSMYDKNHVVNSLQPFFKPRAPVALPQVNLQVRSSDSDSSGSDPLALKGYQSPKTHSAEPDSDSDFEILPTSDDETDEVMKILGRPTL